MLRLFSGQPGGVLAPAKPRQLSFAGGLIARPAFEVEDLLLLVGMAPPVERHHRHLLRQRVPRRPAGAKVAREPILLRLAQHLRLLVEDARTGGLEAVAARMVVAILPRVAQLHRPPIAVNQLDEIRNTAWRGKMGPYV